MARWDSRGQEEGSILNSQIAWAGAAPSALPLSLLRTVAHGAEDTPVGVQGTDMAPEETPVAGTNTDALRNAAQNPAASGISVPIQSNLNFNVGPVDRTQNVPNIQFLLQWFVNYTMK
jgi:hypothetical protein